MNIEQLLKSTISMGYLESYFRTGSKNFSSLLPENRRAPHYVFNNKEFGSMYYYNIAASYKGDIVELSLVMGVATDKPSKMVHRIAIALKGVDYEEVTEVELFNKIAGLNPSSEPERKEMMREVLENNMQPLKDSGKIIIQKSSTERKFLIMSNKIDAQTEIGVRCTCSDFYYSWAWYNADHGCLIGTRPPAYKRKTPMEDRGNPKTTRNPHKIPGMCKHLLLFLALLMRDGLIQTIPDLTGSLSKATSKINVLSRQDIHRLLSNLANELKKDDKGRGGFRS